MWDAKEPTHCSKRVGDIVPGVVVSAIKLCFVNNVLNNKTIILLNLVSWLSIRRYSVRFHRIIVK